MTEAPKIIQNSNGVWMLSGEQLWDTTILPVCLEHIKEGDTVIDAGAWIGGHTMAYLKKVGETGCVHAFEPNPFAFQCLERNTEDTESVIYQTLRGDERGKVTFSAKKGWYDSGYMGDNHKIADVPIETIDYCNIAPNFIKIDVEGCELKVLKGASKTIEKSKPIMVIEINEPALKRQGDTAQQVADWILGHGYEFEFIEKDVTLSTEIYNVLATPR